LTSEDEEENTDVEQEDSEQTEEDFDERENLEEELTYREKLEKWFQEMEDKYGIDTANKLREKSAASKQFELFYNSLEMAEQMHEQQMKMLAQAEAHENAVFENITALIDAQREESNRLATKCGELLKANERQNKEFADKMSAFIDYVKASIDKDDERNEHISKIIEEDALLKRKKLQRDLEKQ